MRGHSPNLISSSMQSLVLYVECVVFVAEADLGRGEDGGEAGC